jgi:hypothetical protein
MIFLVRLSRKPSNMVNKEDPGCDTRLTTTRLFVKLSALKLRAVRTESGQGALGRDKLIKEALHVHAEANKGDRIFGGVD